MSLRKKHFFVGTACLIVRYSSIGDMPMAWIGTHCVCCFRSPVCLSVCNEVGCEATCRPNRKLYYAERSADLSRISSLCCMFYHNSRPSRESLPSKPATELTPATNHVPRINQRIPVLSNALLLHTAQQTTFLNNMFRHLNGGRNPMGQDAVVQAQAEGFFGQSTTLRIEERTFDYKIQENDGGRKGQEYKFFLVVGVCFAACLAVIPRYQHKRRTARSLVPCDSLSRAFDRRHPQRLTSDMTPLDSTVSS